MAEVTSLEEQVLKVNGVLMLLIPLECGGSQLAECAQRHFGSTGRVLENRHPGLAGRCVAYRGRGLGERKQPQRGI
jgi:hypothetical protein